MDTLLADTERYAADLRRRDRAYVWHPWSPANAERDKLMLVRAHGAQVTDADQNLFIDCASLNTTVGYADETVINAIAAQLRFGCGTDISIASHSAVGPLAGRIAGYLPKNMSRTLFVNSGSEAIDAAVFIATSYWANNRAPRQRFVTFSKGYHGSTLASRALSGLPRVAHPLTAPFEVTHVDLPAPAAGMRTDESCEALIAAFRAAIADGPPPAAVLVEPLLNVGGLIVLPEQFLLRLSELCQTLGTLLITDEVYTGFGRCGAMFLSLDMGAKPDIIVSSKGLASGYCPIAAVSATDDIVDSFAKDPHIGGLRYGHTTSGHAPACAAALATLDAIECRNLLSRARTLGSDFRRGLVDLLGSRNVRDVRGLGLANAIEFDSFDSGAVFAVRLRDLGVLVRQAGEAVIISPPLTITQTELMRVSDAIHQALKTPL